MNYYIKTFGCQMNVHESEKLAGMLNSLGYKKSVDEPKDADIIITDGDFNILKTIIGGEIKYES